MIQNLSEYIERSELAEEKIIVSVRVRLDKRTILESLMSDSIYIDGDNFKVPESKLMECLNNNKFGDIKLDLEKIIPQQDTDDLPF